MNPLVIECGIRKFVDLLLGDFDVLRGAKFLANVLLEFSEAMNDQFWHGGSLGL
jgi:hypothetical protein